MKRRIRNSLSGIVLATGSIATAHAAAPSVALWQGLPQLCAQLQTRGWVAASDPRDTRHKLMAEMNIPNVMYMCTLEYNLPGKGPGRSPDLGILLDNSGDDKGMNLSAHIWCAADREATIAGLVNQLENILSGAGVSVPVATLTAIRATKSSELDSDGLHFHTGLIEVDAQACSKVDNRQLGAVLIEIEVSIKPVAALHQGKSDGAR